MKTSLASLSCSLVAAPLLLIPHSLNTASCKVKCVILMCASLSLSVVYRCLCRCASPTLCVCVCVWVREGVHSLDQRLKRFSPQQRDDQQGQGRLCGNTNCSARKSFSSSGGTQIILHPCFDSPQSAKASDMDIPSLKSKQKPHDCFIFFFCLFDKVETEGGGELSANFTLCSLLILLALI